MDKKTWREFIANLSKQTKETQAREIAEVIGAPVDADKPYPEVISLLCDTRTVSKDNDYFYFKISSPRVKQTYAIGANGEVQLVKIAKEGLQTLSVSPLSTPVEYMPINDVLSAKGYDSLALIKSDVTSSMDLAEIEKLFSVLAAAVPGGNEVTLGSGNTKFKYSHLQEMRKAIKDYADQFVLLTGSNIDEDILSWDYDENKYRSIKDMVADLNVTIMYVGAYTHKKDGVDTAVINANKAYLVGLKTQINGKPFIFARKEITSNVPTSDIDSTDEEKQRLVKAIPTIIKDNGGNTVAVYGYWGYEEMNVVCVIPLALAGFTRS